MSTREYRVVVCPGDGIGPEIMVEALRVLSATGRRFGLAFELREESVGAAGIRRHGLPLCDETLERARDADAILFGAVGDPRYDRDPVRPEQAILGLRRGLGLFANLRPVRAGRRGPLRPELGDGVDILFVRELGGGIYFGEPRGRTSSGSRREAVDTMRYDEDEIARIARVGFELSRIRRSQLTSVDKANVLATSALWREVVDEVAAEYPDVALEHRLVDAFAMELLRSPRRFDVVVTGNMFGDIVSDEAAALAGSLGLVASASLGTRRPDATFPGLYEPIHGSAPDIAGQGRANPIGMIRSVALMLRFSLGIEEAADAIEAAVDHSLADGLLTPDLGGAHSTADVGRAVTNWVAKAPAADSAAQDSRACADRRIR